MRNIKSRIKNQAQDNNLLLTLCQKKKKICVIYGIPLNLMCGKKEYFLVLLLLFINLHCVFYGFLSLILLALLHLNEIIISTPFS